MKSFFAGSLFVLLFFIGNILGDTPQPVNEKYAEKEAEPVLPTRFQLVGKEKLEGFMNEWIFIYRDTFSQEEFLKYGDYFYPLSSSKKLKK